MSHFGTNFLVVVIITLNTSQLYGAQIGSECLTKSALPSLKQCTTKFKFEKQRKTFQETFSLTLNDPIEYFRYNSQWRLFGSFQNGYSLYVNPPVVGHIRDQFIDDDPFSNTLLFTTSICGIGLQHVTPWLRFSREVQLIYLKQRYAPNLIHSDEAEDPEQNALYAFSQVGSLSRSSISVVMPMGFIATAEVLMMHIQWQKKVLSNREGNLELSYKLYSTKRLSFGTNLRYFQRSHQIRRDGKKETSEFSRTGLYLEFR